MKYRQKVRFTGGALDKIFRMPCVMAIEKYTCADGKPGVRILVETEEQPSHIAYPGDSICQDYEGGWHVIEELNEEL